MTSPEPIPDPPPEVPLDEPPPPAPAPDALHVYEAEGFAVEWRPGRCTHSGRCVRALPAVFSPKRRPWIITTNGAGEDVMEAVLRCPSGALQLRRHDS